MPAKAKPTWRNSVLIMWDHRDQPDWDEVSAAAQTGHVHFREVINSQDDNYWVVATHTPVTEEEAETIYEAWLAEEEKEFA